MSLDHTTTTPELLLAIDCGTQSVRALVFDKHGHLKARSQVALEGYFSDQSGWMEQHGRYFWDSLCRACQQLWQQGIEPQQLAGVAVTTQRATVIPVDQQGEPVRPAITWMDKREASQIPQLSFWWRAAFKLAGVSATVKQFMRDAEINWLQQHQPEVIAKTHKYLLLSGYLNFQLSGEFKDSIGAQVGYLPFDYKSHQWAKPNSWKWQACPVKPEHLPELVPVSHTLGHITETAHQQTGLPKGLPIVASAADKACETLGCGAIEPHQGQISYGTTATFNTLSKHYIEPLRYLPPYPAALPNIYTCEYQIYRGYWMVSWFKQQFAHKEAMQAETSEYSIEELLDQQAANIKPGANGLILQPYWSPGVRYPGPEARGAIIGFNDSHTRAHIYRALLEGIAFGLYQGKLKMQKRSGQSIREIFVSGGGAQSKTALQITADVFNLPVKLPHTFETSGLGAAINLAVNRGIYPDHQTAVNAMCHVKQEILPIADNVALYKHMHRRVYQKLYGRLSPLYRQLSNLFSTQH